MGGENMPPPPAHHTVTWTMWFVNTKPHPPPHHAAPPHDAMMQPPPEHHGHHGHHMHHMSHDAMVQCMLVRGAILLLVLAGLAWAYCERKRRRREHTYPERTGGDYLTGLWECCVHPRICLPACFFTPFLAAFNRAEADKRDCSMWDVCFSLKTQFTTYQTRQSIRAANNLEEGGCGDCLSACCCTPCAVAQDTLEMEKRAAIHAVQAAPGQATEMITIAPGTPVVITAAPSAPIKDYAELPQQV